MASGAPGYFVREEYCEANPRAGESIPQINQPRIEVLEYSVNEENSIEDRLVFDLIDAPPSHANALRRTLISSIPSIAIEVVGVVQNTGVMPDEILCHRLGLIPLNVDPSLLDFPSEPVTDTTFDPSIMLLFGLHVKGGQGPSVISGEVDSSLDGNLPAIYVGEDGVVKSSHLIWMPLEGQRELFDDIKPLYPDLPITKILPGQEIHLYARAIKGIGSDHAKFSPVCTAFYRMIPQIRIVEDVSKETMLLLKKTCRVGVFDIEDSGELRGINERKCTTCRECLRIPELKGVVEVGKVHNQYEFTVESVGVRTAPTLVRESLQVLKRRSEEMKEAIHRAVQQ